MRAIFFFIAATLLCAVQFTARIRSPPGDARTRTKDRANEIVRRGETPNSSEYSARWMNGQWQVTASHIWYPQNVGASHFAPGRFTSYTMSRNGKVGATMPGL